MIGSWHSNDFGKHHTTIVWLVNDSLSSDSYWPVKWQMRCQPFWCRHRSRWPHAMNPIVVRSIVLWSIEDKSTCCWVMAILWVSWGARRQPSNVEDKPDNRISCFLSSSKHHITIVWPEIHSLSRNNNLVSQITEAMTTIRMSGTNQITREQGSSNLKQHAIPMIWAKISSSSSNGVSPVR